MSRASACHQADARKLVGATNAMAPALRSDEAHFGRHEGRNSGRPQDRGFPVRQGRRQGAHRYVGWRHIADIDITSERRSNRREVKILRLRENPRGKVRRHLGTVGRGAAIRGPSWQTRSARCEPGVFRKSKLRGLTPPETTRYRFELVVSDESQLRNGAIGGVRFTFTPEQHCAGGRSNSLGGTRDLA